MSEHSRVLQVEESIMELGLLQGNAGTEGRFKIRNVSSDWVRLSLGTPSCACLDGALEPARGELAPGEEACVVLTLNTHQRGGGPVSGKVLLGVKGGSESYLLEVSGVLEGLVAAPPYVLRARDFERGVCPDLRFGIFTAKKDTPLELLSVVCCGERTPHPEERQRAEAPSPPAEAPRPPAYGPVLEGVKIATDRMVVGEATELFRAKGFLRQVAIPITATPVESPVAGEFVIRYRLRQGEENVASVKVLLLGSEEFRPYE